MQTDYLKSSEEIILDLINWHNSKYMDFYGIDRIHGRDVIIGAPYALTETNTRITIIPKQTAPYVDPFSFTYRRIHLAELIKKNNDVTFRITETGLLKVSDIIDRINNRWGIKLGPGDYVEDGVFVTEDNYDTTMVVRANQNSLVWTGSIAIRLTSGIPLDSVIKITELDGFGDRTYNLDETITVKELIGFMSIK